MIWTGTNEIMSAMIQHELFEELATSVVPTATSSETR